MPLYEYECAKCGSRTEVIQRVGDGPTGPCDECGGEMQRLLSAPAFQFKGSGWYVTDYASKSGGPEKPAQSSKADSPSEKKPSSSEGGSKDSKKSSD